MSAETLDDFFATCPALLFVADAEGTILCRSRAFAERFGEDTSLASVVAEGERARVAAFFAALAQAQDARVATFRRADPQARDVLRCAARRASTGAIHGHLELVAQSDVITRIEHACLRHIMDNFDFVIWAIDSASVFIYHDGRAVRTAGLEPGQLLGMDIHDTHPAELLVPVEEALTGRSVYYTSEFFGLHWKTWNFPIFDEYGAIESCVGVSVDVSAEVRAHQDLERQLETIRDQRRSIRELSTPLIQVWDRVLVVPLIGSLDDERADDLSARLLDKVGHLGIRFAILDLTGVEALDTSIVGHLLGLVASLGLLGVEALITGISPEIAQTMVGLGVDLGTIQTHRTLRDALRTCMRALMQGAER